MNSNPARYDAIADWYVEFTKDWDSQLHALLPGDLQGLRVLDLACGYGTASRYLAWVPSRRLEPPTRTTQQSTGS